MSAADIQTRLRSLFDANKAISGLSTRLAKLSPDSTSTGGESRADLGAEIHQALKDLEEDYEAARQDADELLSTSTSTTGSALTARRQRSGSSAREQERIALSTQLSRLGEDIAGSRAQFRRAQLQAKRNEEAARRRERTALFAGAGDDSNNSNENAPQLRQKASSRRAELSRDAQLVGAADDVTAALRRTHALMRSELRRSEFAHDTLQRSSAALNELSTSYAGLDGVLGRSRKLVRALRAQERSDSWYLEAALAVLLATLAWLLFRRLAYHPLLYLAYKPARFVIRLLAAIVNATLALFVGGGSAAATGVARAGSGSTSLKVKPSATGKGPANMAGMPAPSANVGGGAKDARASASLSEEVGDMAERTRREEGQQQQGQGEQQQRQQQEGTVLRERRPDEPVNPKKRMMEEPPPEAQSGGKDEL